MSEDNTPKPKFESPFSIAPNQPPRGQEIMKEKPIILSEERPYEPADKTPAKRAPLHFKPHSEHTEAEKDLLNALNRHFEDFSQTYLEEQRAANGEKRQPYHQPNQHALLKLTQQWMRNPFVMFRIGMEEYSAREWGQNSVLAKEFMRTMSFPAGTPDPFSDERVDKIIKSKGYAGLRDAVYEHITQSPQRLGVHKSVAMEAAMLLLQNFDKMCNFSHAIRKASVSLQGETPFLEQWLSGNFNYQRPVLKFSTNDPASEHEINAHDFAAILLDFMKAKTRDSLHDDTNAIAGEAVVDMVSKMIGHEGKLREREIHLQEQREANETKRAESRVRRAQAKAEAALKEQELKEQRATERAQKEQADYEVFMAEHRPFEIDFNDKGGPGAVLAALHSYGSSHINDRIRKARVNALFEVISEAAQYTDMREGTDAKALCRMLFTPGNLITLTKIVGLKDHLPPIQNNVLTGMNEGSFVVELRKAYNISTPQADGAEMQQSPVHNTVDSLLKSDGGALLLATMIFKAEVVKPYADFVLAKRSEMKRAQETMASRLQALEMTGEEMRLLAEGGEDNKEPYYKAQREMEGLQAELDEVRTQVANSIGRVLSGVSTRKVSLPLSSEPISEQPPPGLPHGWNEFVDLKQYRLENSEQGEKYIHVVSIAYPSLAIDLPRKREVQEVRRMMQDFASNCQQHEANMQVIRDLTINSGFEAGMGPKGAQIRHPDYNIEVSLTGTEIEQSKALEKARIDFENTQFQRQQLLDSATEFGINVRYPEKSRQRICFNHPSFAKPVMLGADGYLNDDEALVLEGLIRKVAPQQELSSALPAGENDDQQAVPVEDRMRWMPAKDTNILIFDSGPLIKLSAERNKTDHTTWLDLIKCTANLPNMTVVVPSVIADWEMQGQLPEHDAQGRYTGNTQIRAAHDDNKYRDAFFRSAWRGHLENGQVVIDRKGSTKFLIIETPEDKQLYDKIRSIKRDCDARGLSNGGLMDALERENILRNDEGEKSIERLVNGLPFANPMTIVSDDFRYLNGDPEKPEAIKATQRNPHGTAVAQISTATYLAAEAHKRKFTYLLDWDKKQDEKDLDAGNAGIETRKMPEYNAIAQSIINYWSKGKMNSISLRPHYYRQGDLPHEMITRGRSHGAFNNNNRIIERGHKLLLNCSAEEQYAMRRLPCEPCASVAVNAPEAPASPAPVVESVAPADLSSNHTTPDSAEEQPGGIAARFSKRDGFGDDKLRRGNAPDEVKNRPGFGPNRAGGES